MTKYEWESELKKNIHRLPVEEINRVMEYYDELFADKIERGYGESEIVGSFGNPVDVADKILADYDGENAKKTELELAPVYKSEKITEEREESVCDKKAETKKAGRKLNGSRLALFIVLNVLTAFAFFIVIGALWIAAVAVIISGFGCIGGGVLAAIFALFPVFGGMVASGFAQCGICIAACGLGVIIVSVCGKIIKFMAKFTGKIFGAIGRFICPKEAAYE